MRVAKLFSEIHGRAKRSEEQCAARAERGAHGL
jgi:hypothetical protein